MSFRAFSIGILLIICLFVIYPTSKPLSSNRNPAEKRQKKELPAWSLESFQVTNVLSEKRINRLNHMQSIFSQGSCENLYYNLFSSNQIRDFNDPNFGFLQGEPQIVNAQEQKLNIESGISQILSGIEKLAISGSQMNNWINQIQNLQKINYGPGSGGPYIETMMGKKSLTVGSHLGTFNLPFFDLFFLAHELTHLNEFLNQSTIECLKSDTSIGMNTSSIPIPLSEEEMNFWWLPYRSDLQTILDGAGYLTGIGTEHVSMFEQIVEEQPLFNQQKLYEMFERGRLQFEEMNNLAIRASEFKKKSAANKELIDNFLKRHGSKYLKIVSSQLPEVTADYWASEIVLAIILNTLSNPSERKAALENVLMSLPPLLFPHPHGTEVMDSVGSKLTNESRALRILLAHPSAQSILGCQMQNPVDYCTH